MNEIGTRNSVSSAECNATTDKLNLLVAEKVKEIFKEKWGKEIEDARHLSIERLYERLVKDNRISYKATKMFVLEASFHIKDTRRIRFCLPAS